MMASCISNYLKSYLTILQKSNKSLCCLFLSDNIKTKQTTLRALKVENKNTYIILKYNISLFEHKHDIHKIFKN